jgi:SAM-dependent methyltransferase
MDKSFEERYQDGDLPWDHGMPDENLGQMVERFRILPCPVLDLGCGTGENALWLSGRGFDVTACDLSETAIRMAKEKEGMDAIGFAVRDILQEPYPDASFGFIFDRGCFHCIEGEDPRSRFARLTAGMLGEDGLWLSLIGNADELGREEGPPQMTAAELTTCVEPFFEILALESGVFGSDQEVPPRAWICLMRKRVLA